MADLEKGMNRTRLRSVVITGASSGIGEACTLRLASAGWRVFAGVRKQADGEALVAKAARAGTIVPIVLDVTSREQIAAAAALVVEATGEAGLDGLVNNAGIAVTGPLEFVPMEDIERQFQVNVFGLIAVTQAFLPLIRVARGRLVCMGSNSGFLCEPFAAPYGGTKHALEAIADSLRIELRPFGIEVALIEPGSTKTPAWDKSRVDSARFVATMPPEADALYGRPIAVMREMVDKMANLAIPPDRVARKVQHALQARRPRTRYPVGLDSHMGSILVRVVPDRLRDWIIRRVTGI